MLQLNWPSRPRRVAKRVQEACDVVQCHDRRYHLSLTSGRAGGSWMLTRSRSQATPPATTDLAEAVLLAWRQAHRSRLPSMKQHAILVELLTRRSPSWIVEHLENGRATENRFGYLLAFDK